MRDFTTGQIQDIVSNDVQRIERAPLFFFRIWIALPNLVATAWLMWYFIGWQSLMGMVFLVILVPLAGFLSGISAKLTKKTAMVADRRLLLMNEIVTAIRSVKANTWEWIYRNKIRIIRRSGKHYDNLKKNK